MSYMAERKAFGKSIANFQALQFRLVDMATELEMVRTFLWRAAVALDTCRPDATRLCAMTKRVVTDSCFDVANQALQLHGCYGYLVEYDLEKIVRDLRVHEILEATNEIMRVIIARSIVGQKEGNHGRGYASLRTSDCQRAIRLTWPDHTQSPQSAQQPDPANG